MLKIEEFVQLHKGKIVSDHAGGDYGECVSLCQLYQKYVGWPIVFGNAIDWQYKGTGEYTFIPYRLGRIPHPSDFVIFKTGKYGHIGIVVGANPLTMSVFHQNYPHGNHTDPATVKRFNYLSPKVVGFLRHK